MSSVDGNELELELFVPGRVCLLGEHSDWAGSFRRFNDKICKGFTLVTGTNQGLYARVKRHPSKLVLTTTDNNGAKSSAEFAMDRDTLLAVAREGGFWCYCAGVAYKMLTENIVGGIEIDNYMTTLPLKKGLSSSAAICVLVARAFNKLYDLRLSVRGEMEYAYQGELLTPSQCGRLDQAVAFGSTPVVMSYDGEFTGVDKVLMNVELHMVIVDLCAQKSTVEILKSLQSAYPFAQNEDHENVHKMLGQLNKDIVDRALVLLTETRPNGLETGEEVLEALGKLFNEAQANFDKYGGKVCPSQLTAPVLHKCLAYGPLQKHIYGGKGVGAGGDGTAQLLCKSAEDQQEVAKIVRNELKMDPILLTISSGVKISTAVIPAGGFAGSLFPASQACKAELFPIFDMVDGLCKPLIVHTVEQLLAEGIERVVLIIQQDDLVQFRRLFHQDVSPGNERNLKPEHKLYAQRLTDMGRRVELVVQRQQKGYGHAVYQARDHVGKRPFMLVLGHHYYYNTPGSRSCVKQILEAHKVAGSSVMGVKRTPLEQVSKFGTIAGSCKEGSGFIQISSIIEKPDQRLAKSSLHVDGFPENEFLTVFGMYAIEHDIFGILEEFIEHDLRDKNGLLPFTPALEELRKTHGVEGVLVEGERFPLNTPEGFVNMNTSLLARRSSP
uniref:UTP--glucose-1-phosphate uridylyltransferase n=1 Tax=Mucochytrium quahogii TaxID=96639 RepID=A0A7S2RRZ4_9STRA|mmetsp:Transcript_11675/g.19004  ORF Transcript_11675/g.19004 Transcript_11675/m.19004 type:complete len:667 (-) Transcript_11675:258-2258(-)